MKLFGESRCILWSESDNKRALEMSTRRLVVQLVQFLQKFSGIRNPSLPLQANGQSWRRISNTSARWAGRSDPL